MEHSIKPREWQKAALKNWSQELKGVVRVVTGAGKTIFAYLCIEEFFKHFDNGRVTILVPSIALLDQWLLDIQETLNIPEEDIACYSGLNRPKEPAKINIMVLNTGRNTAFKISNHDDQPQMLVVDECHRAGSVENARALEGDYAATLGISATPERENDEGFEERIAPVLGPIIFEYDYAEAHRDGVIVDFDLVNIGIDKIPDETLQTMESTKHVEDMLGESVAGCNEDQKKQMLQDKTEHIGRVALRVPSAVKLALMHKSERVIIFHERVESVQHIIDLLSQNGQNSVAYHSQLSDAYRRDNLRLFRKNMVNMLVTCRALDEGANIPEANVAIVAHSTSSTRQRIQRLGRVLRPAQGKTHAVVYTFFVNEEESGRLAEEARNLNGVARITWKKMTIR